MSTRDRSWLFEDDAFRAFWDYVSPYTMTSPERGYALYLAVRHLVDNQIHGSLVECGVWRGGSAMLMLLALNHVKAHRQVVLFDTFEGMTEPGELDIDHRGVAAADLLSKEAATRESAIWAMASEEEVRANLAGCGYDARLIRLVRGDVRQTLAGTQTGPIALLRLDTDFYDSTLAELEQLYPHLVQGGIMLIDDYGHWSGARKAVDDYFSARHDEIMKPLLQPIDYTGRLAVKLDMAEEPHIQRYDYVPPGLENPGLLSAFPSLQAKDPAKVGWRYLRHRVPHIWRSDSRNERGKIGVLSMEEAVLLYALARPFAGRRALEIGCHLGWSTAHLLAAGLDLDVIDPALGEEERQQDVIDSLGRLETKGACSLWAGSSPAMVAFVRRMRDAPWSFVFIDGNHDGPAPRLDAEAVLPHCASDALVVFHDLVSPDVAEGLRYFKENGWETRLYNTMQVMGVAWRGNASPAEHVPDVNTHHPVLPHLADLGPFAQDDGGS